SRLKAPHWSRRTGPPGSGTEPTQPAASFSSEYENTSAFQNYPLSTVKIASINLSEPNGFGRKPGRLALSRRARSASVIKALIAIIGALPPVFLSRSQACLIISYHPSSQPEFAPAPSTNVRGPVRSLPAMVHRHNVI